MISIRTVNFHFDWDPMLDFIGSQVPSFPLKVKINTV